MTIERCAEQFAGAPLHCPQNWRLTWPTWNIKVKPDLSLIDVTVNEPIDGSIAVLGGPVAAQALSEPPALTAFEEAEQLRAMAVGLMHEDPAHAADRHEWGARA